MRQVMMTTKSKYLTDKNANYFTLHDDGSSDGTHTETQIKTIKSPDTSNPIHN